jgi:hypothetical protein
MAVRVSQIARDVLVETLKESGVRESQGLRLTAEDGNYVLTVDTPGGKDRVIDYSGQILLILDRSVERDLGDALVDVDAQTGESRLVLRRKVRSPRVEP